MPWAIVTNYTVEFLGLRWSAPLARFYRPPTLLAACTTRKSNELELKYTLSVYVQPGHCLISCPLAGLARAARPRTDGAGAIDVDPIAMLLDHRARSTDAS